MALNDELVRNRLQSKGWKELYITQEKAIDAGLVEKSENSVVFTPTASGKTGIGELAMLQALRSDERIVYFVPLKVLISQMEEGTRDGRTLKNENA